jgi:hypothetical protein
VVVPSAVSAGDLAQGEGKARQPPEQPRQMAVDRLVDPRRRLHQLLGRRRKIARIGAQLADERLAAGLAGLARDLLHLGADPRDLAQADIVDLLRLRSVVVCRRTWKA